MASLTLRLGATGATGVKNAPLTNAEIDNNFKNLNTEVGTKLASADYTASDILTKLKTVDGSGSGLDADLLDGLNKTSLNTVSSIVARDSSGNFAANQITAAQLIGPLYLGTTDTIVFEGSSDDAYETTLTVTNPTADRTITFPDLSGTVVVSGAGGAITNAMLAGSITNDKLVNSSITIDGNAVSLGGSVSITGADLTWTGTQTFRDNKFLVVDDVDNTKKLALQISNVSTGTTRTLTVADANGIIATREWVGAKTIQSISAGTPSNSTGVDGDIIYQY